MSNGTGIIAPAGGPVATAGKGLPVAPTDPSKTFVAQQVDASQPSGRALNDGLALDRAGKPRDAQLKYDEGLSLLLTAAFGADAARVLPQPPADRADANAWVAYDRQSHKAEAEILHRLAHAPAELKESPKFAALRFGIETAFNRKGVADNHLGPAHQPEALATFRALLGYDGRFGPARYNEAVSLLKVGLPKDAIKELTKALAATNQPLVSKQNVRNDGDWQALPAGLREKFDALTR
jgi:tetratricopeptide (TPR) repeat protein